MKAANRNLLLFGFPAILLLVGGIVLFRNGEALLWAAQSISPELPSGEVGDVEGYAFLIGLMGSGFGQLAGLAVQIVAILVAGYGGGLLVLSLIARAIYKTTPGRLLAYRIAMALDLLFLLLPVPEFLRMFIDSIRSGSASFGMFAVLLLIASVAVLCFLNTYTGRIREPQCPSARENPAD